MRLFRRLIHSPIPPMLFVFLLLLLRPVIHHTVALEDACDTLQHQFSEHKVGKIVVRI